ncbi:MAG TPA: hypothetical protein PLX66_00515 [Bacilli bacterium]|nr:hypothetical protein [Bacilli bacterium]
MTNKFIVYITILALILIIGIPTYLKVNKNYQERAILTIENKIKIKAVQCWNENKCPNNIIYLNDLYDLNYLDKVINPLTKEEINKEAYVEKEEDNTIVVNLLLDD